jgi:hypothetical protein
LIFIGQAGVGCGHSLRSVALLCAFIASVWSCSRSYFEKGHLEGLEEATREIVRGACSHYELEGHAIPERVAKLSVSSSPSLREPEKSSMV